MRHSMEGRAPLRCIGSRLLMITRDGNTVRLHDASPETNFKKLHEVKASFTLLAFYAISPAWKWSIEIKGLPTYRKKIMFIE